MVFFLSLIGVLLAMPVQRLFNGAGHYFQPPLAFFAAIFSFWHLKFSQRMWLAIITGLILDTLSGFPFGANLFALITAGLLAELMQILFTNIDSLFTKAVGASITLWVTLTLLYPFGYVISYVKGDNFFWSNRAEIDIMIYALCWSIILPLLVFGAINLVKKKL